ncbi:MAG: toll/interleukin-1 receptor domain-containing protein [Xanthobacteraceae bacterium]
MPYLTGFNNDIFISYASVDNEPDPQGARWVSQFRSDIETALRRRLGRDVGVFFDQADLHAFDELNVLLDNARTSAIFLAVCSPSYLEREWTLDELKSFSEVAKSSSGGNRIVTIELLRVDESSLPLQLVNLKRTRFYASDQDSETDFTLTPASERFRDVYNERLQQLAHNLVLLLRDLRDREQVPVAPVRAEQAAPTRSVPVAAVAIGAMGARTGAITAMGGEQIPQQGPKVEIVGAPQVTVLLAQVTDDIYDERQRVASYLEDYKIRVVPVGEYPESGAKFASAVAADLQNADLFVQLLGRVRSLKPEDLRGEGEPARSYAQFQYDAARRRGIPVLQWRHPDITLDKIPPVNWDRQLLQSPDVRVMGLQDFMKEIRGTIDQLKQKPESKTPRDGFVFINADRSDQILAQTLFKAFNDNACSAVVPMEDSTASAKEIEEDLEANLIDCSALLLLYGQASLAWVRAQIRRFMKLESQRREPLRIKTIVCGPPPAKPNVGVSGFQLVDWQDGATDERVDEIIKELRV